jgi:hypothetical protein
MQRVIKNIFILFIWSLFVMPLNGCDFFNMKRADPVFSQEIKLYNNNKMLRYDSNVNIVSKDKYYFELRYQVNSKEERKLVIDKFDKNNKHRPKIIVKLINEAGNVIYKSNEEYTLYLLGDDYLIVDILGFKNIELSKGKYQVFLELSDTSFFRPLSNLTTTFEISNAKRGK